jgi:hypothetical protein
VPHDVVADAFYQKGGGMDALIPIIGALQLIERRDPLPARVVAPLLIQGIVFDQFREACVTIACGLFASISTTPTVANRQQIASIAAVGSVTRSLSLLIKYRRGSSIEKQTPKGRRRAYPMLAINHEEKGFGLCVLSLS